MKKLLLLLIIPLLSFGQIVTEDCSSIPDPGICLAYVQVFYFDQTTSQCEESYWGGCGGVVPFWTLEECQNSCENTEIGGCTDENACNYDSTATVDHGSCTYPALPYDWDEEYGYDCEGNCLLPEDMCSCEEINYDEVWLIEGCWWPVGPPDNWLWAGDSQIYYFDSLNCAITAGPNCGCLDDDDDGWCDDLGLIGCTDWPACNFNPNAIQDDGSCIYAEEYYDCDGNCLEDLDDDGICDSCETMDYLVDEWCNCDIDLEYAVYYTDVDEINCVTIQTCYCVCNNDSDEDGVCDENEVIFGCTDSLACNVFWSANEDDGSCE